MCSLCESVRLVVGKQSDGSSAGRERRQRKVHQEPFVNEALHGELHSQLFCCWGIVKHTHTQSVSPSSLSVRQLCEQADRQSLQQLLLLSYHSLGTLKGVDLLLSAFSASAATTLAVDLAKFYQFAFARTVGDENKGAIFFPLPPKIALDHLVLVFLTESSVLVSRSPWWRCAAPNVRSTREKKSCTNYHLCHWCETLSSWRLLPTGNDHTTSTGASTVSI